MTQQCHFDFNSTPWEATVINFLPIRFIMIYENVFFISARIVNIWNNLPNSVVNASRPTVNAFKAR